MGCTLIRHLMGIFTRWGCVEIWPRCGAVNNEWGSSVKCVCIGRITSTQWPDLMAQEGPRHVRRSAGNEDLRASGSTQNKKQQTQHGIVSHQSASLTAPSAVVCSLLYSQPPLRFETREPCVRGVRLQSQWHDLWAQKGKSRTRLITYCTHTHKHTHSHTGARNKESGKTVRQAGTSRGFSDEMICHLW